VIGVAIALQGMQQAKLQMVFLTKVTFAHNATTFLTGETRHTTL
jgi:hypothetical protein